MRTLLAPVALAFTLGSGCVAILDETPPVLGRDPASTYALAATVDSSGALVESVSAFVDGVEVPLSPVPGTGRWTAPYSVSPCARAFGVVYVARYREIGSPSVDEAIEPRAGEHLKQVSGEPPATCASTFGARFVVDASADAPDASPLDGACVSTLPSQACTLRAAVMQANALPGPDLIELPPFPVYLTIAGDDDDASAGDLDILDDLTIQGAPNDPSIVENDGAQDRVLDVLAQRPDLSVRLVDVWIREGQAFGGGGIRNEAALFLERVVLEDNLSTQAGGAIVNRGYLDVTDSTLRRNRNERTVGGAIAHLEGYLRVRGSTFYENDCDSQHGGALALAADFEIENTTISGNEAEVWGGGVFIDPGVQGTIRNSTLVDNRSQGGGGLLHGGLALNVRLSHNIIARNFASRGRTFGIDCRGNYLSLGHNLLGVRDACNLDDTLSDDDLSGTAVVPLDPRLGPLSPSIGPTRVHLPQLASPAIDAGRDLAPSWAQPLACLPEDQRGLTRPAGVRCDIGAVERQ